jgi:hypothetical protein
MRSASFLQAALTGPGSIIAASHRLTNGRASARTLARWTPVGSRQPGTIHVQANCWDRTPARRRKVEGYRPRSFDCEAGAQFHHSHVSGGPPIIPDSRISQVRFRVLVMFLPWAFPDSARFKRRFAYAQLGLVGSWPSSISHERLTGAESGCPGDQCNDQVPRAPSPNVGVTFIGET